MLPRIGLKRYARHRVNARLTSNHSRLTTSLQQHPDAVEAREKLWMQRHRLQNKLEDLT